jgi:hypothetical protein
MSNAITPVGRREFKRVTVLFINNVDGGFPKKVEVPEGTTAGQFFASQMDEGAARAAYLIRINHHAEPEEYALKDGDRFSVTQRNVKGAA